MAGEKEAAQIAAVEASAASTVANATATAAAIVESAAADVARAQETAQDIAAAAMQAPLAQKVAELEQDAETWEHEQEQHHASHVARLSSLETMQTEILSRLNSLETPKPVVVLTPALNNSADQSLIPAASETPVEAVIVAPETSIPLPASGDIAPAAPRKLRTRFL